MIYHLLISFAHMITCVLFVHMVTCAFDSPYHACLERAAVMRPPLVYNTLDTNDDHDIYCDHGINEHHEKSDDDTSICQAWLWVGKKHSLL